MKKLLLALVVCGAVLAVAANTVVAQDKGGKGEKGKKGKRPHLTAEETFAKMDTKDPKGEVNLDEFKAFYSKMDPAKAEKLFNRISGNEKVFKVEQYKKFQDDMKKAAENRKKKGDGKPGDKKPEGKKPEGKKPEEKK